MAKLKLTGIEKTRLLASYGTTARSFVCFALVLASLSGCTLLKGRKVSLHQSRLTVLESNESEVSAIKRITLMIRNCPTTLAADELVRRALGAQTSIEVVESGSKDSKGLTRDALTMECTTAVERDGGALGASQPAAIGLAATLSSSNEVVWSARYFYRDENVASDVLTLKDRFEVGGGGVRFASLPELASAGFEELARELGRAQSGALIRR